MNVKTIAISFMCMAYISEFSKLQKDLKFGMETGK
jgi:hypothetical protein